MKVKPGCGQLIEDAPIILPKAALWSVILSTHTLAFCNLLTQNMTSLARATDTKFPNTARVLLEYGMDKEGYWTSEKLFNLLNELLNF